jgi:hypothetical protein
MEDITFNSNLYLINPVKNPGNMKIVVEKKNPVKYNIPPVTSAMDITRVIPAINGGHGLSPVMMPAMKGKVFPNLRAGQFFPFLASSVSTKPLIPQKIKRIPVMSLNTNSYFKRNPMLIPSNEKINPMKRYDINLPRTRKTMLDMTPILLISLEVNPNNTGMQ